ncbi:MAG: glycoside hydrolase family 73 protein [Aerococcus sp.]|nr:glycoside hydrolase family 73 protein [Aerococcus sp.]
MAHHSKWKKRRHSKKQKRQQWQKQGFAIGLLVLVLLIISLYFPSKKVEIPPVTSSDQAFIDEVSQYAVDNYKTSHVLPSVVVAQAALESNFGHSELAANYYNLFGYKASAGEQQVTLTTKEYVNGQWQTIQAPFKVYVNWQQSIKDHGKLMQNGTDWDPTLYQGVVNATNYKRACRALAKAGYATDPDYADKLIAIIQQYHLTALDQKVKT